MLKKVALVLLLVCVCIGCCACGRMSNVNESVEPELFSIVTNYDYGRVIVDNKTGVMYWMSTGCYNNGTLTLLVDETGNPKIFERR